MFTTNSSEAVPGLSGLAGTILVAGLILLVVALVIAVVATYVRKNTNQSQKVADALLVVVNTAMGAAVIAGSSSLVVVGSSLYLVPKVEAERAPAQEASTECSDSVQIGPLGDSTDEIAELTDWEAPDQASFETVKYWPDPGNDCNEGRSDPCLMIEIRGSKPADGAMGNLTDVGFSEWAQPKGECSSGEPEQKDFT